MKILHVAPLNVAGVPYSMMLMQRQFGHSARLVSLHTNAQTFPEDICLHLPLPRNAVAGVWRRHKRLSQPPSTASSSTAQKPLQHGPRNMFEALYFRYDDHRREKTVYRCLDQYGFDDVDVIHYDGGLDFFRDARVARRWKREGKKIVCHYMGSDLRVRGVDPIMDELSDLNLTNESDHLHLHPNIHYLFIPFDHARFTPVPSSRSTLRIIHSPTNRAFKGTHLILPVIEKLKGLRPIEFVLAENMPHEELLALKATCDLAIEQIGNFGGTGYGVNSLETMALGIPTITEMTPDYVAWIPDNPFVLATRETLLDRLLELIDNPGLRAHLSAHGRTWVAHHHSYESVHAELTRLYHDHGIVSGV